MSDTNGQVIADGELTQERAGDRVRVRIRWAIADGREVEERDEFQVDGFLAQRRFSWVETRKNEELRSFEVDFSKDDPVVVIDVTPRGAAHPPRSLAQQRDGAASR
ncbi:MAG TPA: hypothetical protein VGK85_11245 [Myxococcaceae bacterium]